MARALHSVTHVSPGRFLVAGGQSALGPLSHVGVLASPSVLQAERLQRESLQQQLDLLRLGEERAELEGQLKGCQARMAQAQVERTVRGRWWSGTFCVWFVVLGGCSIVPAVHFRPEL